jgi:hypothetical protein
MLPTRKPKHTIAPTSVVAADGRPSDSPITIPPTNQNTDGTSHCAPNEPKSSLADVGSVSRTRVGEKMLPEGSGDPSTRFGVVHHERIAIERRYLRGPRRIRSRRLRSDDALDRREHGATS